MEQNIDISAPKSTKATIFEWLQVIIIALLISLPIRFFIAEPFIVDGASMDPTFSTGQFLIVDRLSYRISEPKRGDVVVFKYPNDTTKYYIKRIIGLPGETVSMKDGEITILNNAHPEGFLLNEPYIESLHKAHDTVTVTLDQGYYFVMGDNRLQSYDSRAWGSLEENLIVGKPIVRLFPIQQLSFWPGKEDQ